MGLKEIKQAGEMASRLSDVAQSMNTIHNQYSPRYNEMLTGIKTTLGNEKTLTNLTDEEINSFFYFGLGDATAITDAQIILQGWETCIVSLSSIVAVLPANDI